MAFPYSGSFFNSALSDVTDRVNVTIYADGDNYAELNDSLENFRNYVLAQTLSADIVLMRAEGDVHGAEVEWGDTPINIDVRKI